MSKLSDVGAPLASGRMADVYACGADEVLKLCLHWVPAVDADHEAGLTIAANRMGLPVPRCFGRTIVAGRRGGIFERVIGTPLLHTLLLEPERAG